MGLYGRRRGADGGIGDMGGDKGIAQDPRGGAYFLGHDEDYSEPNAYNCPGGGRPFFYAPLFTLDTGYNIGVRYGDQDRIAKHYDKTYFFYRPPGAPAVECHAFAPGVPHLARDPERDKREIFAESFVRDMQKIPAPERADEGREISATEANRRMNERPLKAGEFLYIAADIAAERADDILQELVKANPELGIKTDEFYKKDMIKGEILKDKEKYKEKNLTLMECLTR